MVAACVALIVAVGAYFAGRDAAVSNAAVAAERLDRVTAEAEAIRGEMTSQAIVDATQNQRLYQLEEQHRELMQRLGALVDVMWKDEIRRQERR
jgi:hypothetical protein